MMSASIGQKIISLTYFTIIARALGAEKIGIYASALAMTTMFVIFVDLGFTNVLIREASKYKEKLQNIFSTVLFSKIFFGILSYIALAVVVQLLGFDIEFKRLVYVSGITMIFDSFHLSVYGAMRSLGNLKYEAIGMVSSQFITLVLGTFFVFSGFPLIYLMIAFLVPSFLNSCYSALVASIKYKIKIVPKYSKANLKIISKIAVPFALAAIFGRIYSYIDVILLKKIAGDVQVGYYSTPSKISFAFQFIPLALVASLFPRFSEYFVSNKERLAYIFEQSMKFLFLVALPISIGIYVLADDIIIFVFTEKFIHSIAPLKILVISLSFSFISFPIAAFLNACSKQVAQTVIAGCVLVVNVVCNLILIPKFGAVGAAYSALAGNICLALFGYLIIPKITKISHLYIFRTFVQIFVSAALMGVFVWYINMFIHFIWAILLAAALYIILLFATRAVNKMQVKELVALVKK